MKIRPFVFRGLKIRKIPNQTLHLPPSPTRKPAFS